MMVWRGKVMFDITRDGPGMIEELRESFKTVLKLHTAIKVHHPA